MLYREIIAVCSVFHTKHINTLCGQNVELLNVKRGCKYSNHSASMADTIHLGYVVSPLKFRKLAAGSSRPYYFHYHFCYHTPHALNFYYTFSIFSNLLSSFLNHISLSRHYNIY
jgi:hypothetical protein